VKLDPGEFRAAVLDGFLTRLPRTFMAFVRTAAQTRISRRVVPTRRWAMAAKSLSNLKWDPQARSRRREVSLSICGIATAVKADGDPVGRLSTIAAQRRRAPRPVVALDGSLVVLVQPLDVVLNQLQVLGEGQPLVFSQMCFVHRG
jgi:hypothetical protein